MVGGAHGNIINASIARRIDVSLISQTLEALNVSSMQPITSESSAASLLQALSSSIHSAAAQLQLSESDLQLSTTILERTVWP